MRTPSKIITLALSSILTITLSSCGDKKAENTTAQTEHPETTKTHESVAGEAVDAMSEMSSTLAQITDLDSAKSAATALTKIGFKFKMIKTDMQKLGQPTKETTAEIEAKYGAQMKEAKTKIANTMNSLKSTNPKAFEAIGKVMKTVLD